MTTRRTRITHTGVAGVVTCFLVAGSINACASSSGTTATTATPRRTSMSVAGTRAMDIYNEPGVGERTLPAPAPDVWGVMTQVYDQLGVPITTIDPTAMVIGNNLYNSRRVEGQRMSAYIDCGTTLQGRLADLYEITLSVVTRLTAVDEGTTVTTVVDAYGEPRTVSGNRVHCQSIGVLEMRVAQIVADKLGLVN